MEMMTDEELARHACRAYGLARQHSEDPWIAVARMMKAYLEPEECPLASRCPLAR
jgi:hypothetical protein